MEIQAVGLTGVAQQSVPNKSSEDIEMSRKAKDYEAASEQASAAESNKVQPEELLNQIKSLTEDGVYSVRFENDDEANRLVVKVVDSKTDEVIRQVPAEEVLSLSVRLEELRGNIVNTEG
ncbi:flagellar protein FlaG [uncultured Desulfuromonas sp.]|uniref:flagellar protein FlaG n=1 Tax=uncultured Desulfuromonas sp. TaxID=181013 RepID=UPI002AABE9BD|nr:flagellar protein FlaG [uncultured Desulfuromonas sp.]